MDTCIAIRTMTFKDGVAYLQAGGGIVYDSVEEEEYIETINKLKANVNCIAQAEGVDYSRIRTLFETDLLLLLLEYYASRGQEAV
jgi:anthranilate synthase component 1